MNPLSEPNLYIISLLRQYMDGHPPTPTQARMMNLEYPKAATNPNGETFTAFLHERLPFRVFVELTAEQAENIDAPKYTGKTEGGEITGVTGSEYLTFAPVTVLTVFTDITDLEGWSVEWAEGLHPQNLENHLEFA